ncbi:MAG: DUF4395 domain-containing protein [Deltaproteobacteria bacterium]|nr:DUF4395 domain-containing protein [Deltaproteobacteria bacterium]
MKMAERSSTVDQNELRVNSALVIIGLVTAFIIKRWELVAFQAVALFLTTLHPSLGPYVAVYRHILRPAGIVKPDLRGDNPEPHRFATMFGTIVATTAAYLLATGRNGAGWGLVWLLISLATAGFFGWCAGCFVYYVMNRLGLRRLFKHAPVVGTFPGVRPPKA